MDPLVENQHVNDARGYGKLSKLEIDCIYKIFFNLDANGQKKFGEVSEGWRKLLISNPYVKFECYHSPDDPSCSCAEFTNYVDGILSQRDGAAMVSLRLRWVCFNSNCNAKRQFVDKWTNIAVSCGVQELDLAVVLRPGDELLKMLYRIFSSKFLRVLKLDLTHDILLRPFGVLASLEDLSLSKMFFSDGCLEEWISTACPSLKRLTISNLSYGIRTVRISSESLEELDIFNLPRDINKIDISTERLRKLSLDLNPLHNPIILKVEAPNLQDLKWTGAVNDIYLSEWKFLKKASLCLGINETYYDEETIYICLAKLLQSIHHVRELQINNDIFELLFRYLDAADALQFWRWVALNNLHHLTITLDGLKEYHFSVFASVLMVLPKLETLYLKFSGKPYQSHDELSLCSKAAEFNNFYKLDEENQNLIGDHLSAIVVELKGNIYENFSRTRFVIAKMAEVANGLKKITIFYPGERLVPALNFWISIWKAASPRLEVNLIEKRI